MNTWVLIITLYVSGSYNGGATVAAVGGFATREACLAAGDEWLRKQSRSDKAGFKSHDMNALCVQSGPAK